MRHDADGEVRLMMAQIGPVRRGTQPVWSGADGEPPFTHTRVSVEALPMFTAMSPAMPVTNEFGVVPVNTDANGWLLIIVAKSDNHRFNSPVTLDGTFLSRWVIDRPACA